MKYYRARKGWLEIDEIDVERETTSSIWINGRKNQKLSSFYNYFKTRDEAKTFLFNDACNQYERAVKNLDFADQYRTKAASL